MEPKREISSLQNATLPINRQSFKLIGIDPTTSKGALATPAQLPFAVTSGNLVISHVTQAQYDALTPDVNTIYVVDNPGESALVIGDGRKLWQIDNPNGLNDFTDAADDLGVFAPGTSGIIDAVVWHDSKVYFVQGRQTNLYRVDDLTDTTSVVNLGPHLLSANRSVGMASFDGKLLIINDENGQIYNINPDDPDDESGDFGLLGTTPLPHASSTFRAMTTFNGQLIVAANNADGAGLLMLRIVDLDNIAGSTNNLVTFADFTVESIAGVGSNLYLGNDSNNRIERWNSTDGKTILGALHPGDESLGGMTGIETIAPTTRIFLGTHELQLETS